MSVTEEDIGNAFAGIRQRMDAEYAAMSQADLERKWHFRFDPEKSLTLTLYEFNDALDSYRWSCRRWEEMHNGMTCVVERVRDTYLLPKIREFEAQLRIKIAL